MRADAAKKKCVVAILGIKTSKQYLWWCEVLNEKQSTGKIAIANLNRGFSNGPKKHCTGSAQIACV